MVVAKGWGRRREQQEFNEDRVSVLQDASCRDLLHNSVTIANATELYPPKWIRWYTLLRFLLV